MSAPRNVVVRYFTTITPKEDGSIIHWRGCPESFSGVDLRNALANKGLPFSDHLPQVYNNTFKGFENLDSDAVFRFLPEQETMMLDMRLTPLAGPLGEVPEPEKESKSSPVAMANGGPIALLAFCFTTLLLMTVETGVVEHELQLMVMAYAMFHGGLVQLLIGFYELYRNNLFGATAFASYGAFWMGWSLFHILVEAEVLDSTPFPDGKCAYLAMWGVFTTMMFIQTLFINRALQAIFFLLALCFFLLAGGVYNSDLVKAGGWVGFVLAAVVFYTAMAELYNDLGSISLPLFPVGKHKAEHGNSMAGRGEVLRRSDPAGVVALRLRQNKEVQEAGPGIAGATTPLQAAAMHVGSA